ncbi:hypothetical protein VRRI112168_00470 [Vreelandella rituensis]|uniref:Lipoprotein n=1 Tax=Vreelandella rituensis TaxID=2282306 RepID=A0A368U9D6_9GAMM|nr:hypothetical protein [Halomonas rituensis]RCV93829.1 hypothetical protein DU506_01340 [Halomonas rituensis]
MTIRLSTLAPCALAATLLAGCGTDFEEQYTETDRPVVLSCLYQHVTTDYAPDGLRLRSTANSDTTWYRDHFLRTVGLDFLPYGITLPEYSESAPAHIQDRPIAGNVLPYDTFGLAYYYMDDEDGPLKPMSIFFNRFETALNQNVSRRSNVQYPFWFWVTAPAEAKYIVVKAFDNPLHWNHNTKGTEWISDLDELWYARQADSLIRADWASRIDDDARTLTANGKTPTANVLLSDASDCRLESGIQSLGRGSMLSPSTEDDLLRRDERRRMHQMRYASVEGKDPEYTTSPNTRAPKGAPGLIRHTQPAGKRYGFPLVAFSETDLKQRIADGDLDASWDEDDWRAPLR